MEVLVRMNARLLRRRPTGCINRRGNLRRVVLPPPLNQQRNRVLRVRHTAHSLSGALRRRRRHLSRQVIRHHALADVDMVRVQIVRDITVPAGPGLERLQLELRLAHVAVEVVEVAQRAGFGARIRVRRVEAFVVLDEDEDAVFARLLDESDVVGEELCRGLGDQDVDSALDGVERDGEVRCVGGEDCDCGAGLERVDRGFVGVWVCAGVGWVGGEGDVEAVVDFGDVLAEVFTWDTSS